MKYKVGDKVKAKGDKWFNEGEALEIVEASPWDKTYRCSNGENVWWQDDSTLESIDQSLTFQQKLDRFKRELIGFRVRTKEIADELAKVFTKEGLTGCASESASEFMAKAWDTFGKEGKLYISYNYPGRSCSLSYGLSDSAGKGLKEILELTMEDFKDSQTVITITSDGYHRVTAESNGKTAEALCNPTDTVDVAEGAKLAIQRLTDEPKKPKVDPNKYHKFHKGDVAKILLNAEGAASDYIGNYVTIQDDSYVPLVKINGSSIEFVCYEHELELADEVPKFSVGDTVEVINGGPNNTPVESKGMRGKVIEIYSGKISVEFRKILGSSSKTDNNFWYRSKDLKLVPKDEFMFHKGDLVEVIKEGMLTNGSIGLQGIVMEDDNDPFVTLVTEVNGGKRWCFNQENLKLIRRANV